MSKEKRQKVVCPKCGGRLIYDVLYQVSHIHKISPDGTISVRFKRGDEGPEDFAYVRCERGDFIVGPDEYDEEEGRIKLLQDEADDEDEEDAQDV